MKPFVVVGALAIFALLCGCQSTPKQVQAARQFYEDGEYARAAAEYQAFMKVGTSGEGFAVRDAFDEAVSAYLLEHARTLVVGADRWQAMANLRDLRERGVFGSDRARERLLEPIDALARELEPELTAMAESGRQTEAAAGAVSLAEPFGEGHARHDFATKVRLRAAAVHRDRAEKAKALPFARQFHLAVARSFDPEGTPAEDSRRPLAISWTADTTGLDPCANPGQVVKTLLGGSGGREVSVRFSVTHCETFKRRLGDMQKPYSYTKRWTEIEEVEKDVSPKYAPGQFCKIVTCYRRAGSGVCAETEEKMVPCYTISHYPEWVTVKEEVQKSEDKTTLRPAEDIFLHTMEFKGTAHLTWAGGRAEVPIRVSDTQQSWVYPATYDLPAQTIPLDAERLRHSVAGKLAASLIEAAPAVFKDLEATAREQVSTASFATEPLVVEDGLAVLASLSQPLPEPPFSQLRERYGMTEGDARTLLRGEVPALRANARLPSPNAALPTLPEVASDTSYVEAAHYKRSMRANELSGLELAPALATSTFRESPLANGVRARIQYLIFADIYVGAGPGRVAGYEFAFTPLAGGGDGGRDTFFGSLGGVLGHRWDVETGESDTLLGLDLRGHWRLIDNGLILSASFMPNLLGLAADKIDAHYQHRLGAELTWYPVKFLFLRAGSTFYFGRGPLFGFDGSAGVKLDVDVFK